MIICFHEIGYQDNPWTCTPEDFRKCLELYPDAEIHFDDGRMGAYTAADILDEFNRKAKYFLVVNWLFGGAPINERYSDFMGDDEVEDLLKRGHTIGSHGVNHVPLTYLSKDEIMKELLNSKRFLEQSYEVSVEEFSFPYGLSSFTVQPLTMLVYKKGYSLQGSLAGIPRTLFSKALLER